MRLNLREGCAKRVRASEAELTPQYVACEIKKALPVSYLRVQRYAERNADKLKAIAKLERERGSNTHTLE